MNRIGRKFGNQRRTLRNMTANERSPRGSTAPRANLGWWIFGSEVNCEDVISRRSAVLFGAPTEMGVEW
jgi:hypothetical protein